MTFSETTSWPLHTAQTQSFLGNAKFDFIKLEMMLKCFLLAKGTVHMGEGGGIKLYMYSQHVKKLRGEREGTWV